MRYVYFTKSLQSLDVPSLITFFKESGLDGADMAVRPEFPVTPANAREKLPDAAKQFRDAGMTLAIVSTPTNLADPASPDSISIFEACAKAGVPAVKIGYFRYNGKFDADLAVARQKLAGFAKLAERTGVRVAYHTHSGTYIGNNAAGLRMLLQDADAHHVNAYLDTGHLAVNGGPIRQEFDIARPWLGLIAIKDMLWEKGTRGWQPHVVPAGEGIVKWNEVAQAVKACQYDGVISLHGEYETKDLAERKEWAKKELAFLKKLLK
jgi:sugar phosphate isomerase/epimerase